ncbi:Bacterial alpha-L-rhamnosidase [candidate division KSB1 bacterium]|nr:Bacterial alpha-L-rhamnosidase [candidate division KSB1 bacterium]
MEIQWRANWIWIRSEEERNVYVNARRCFYLQRSVARAYLRISADSRYRLFLNSEWMGDGPCRSFPHLQQYDSYDVTQHLQDGRNCLAISVVHYGESTFQYILARGGLLCQLDIEYTDGSSQIFGTDSTWKVNKEKAFLRPVARISCQMPFEEIFDANQTEPGWTGIDYDDSGWQNSINVGAVGNKPWLSMQPRTIPFLTRQPRPPVRIIEINKVRTVTLQETVHVKSILLPGDKSSNMNHYRGQIYTMIASPKAQSAVLKSQFSLFMGAWILNRKPIDPPEQRDTIVDFAEGDNLLVVELIGINHNVDFSLAIDAEVPVALHAPLDGPGKWLIAAPLDPDEERARDQAVALRNLNVIKKRPELLNFTVADQEEIPLDVWNLVYSQEIEGPLPQKVTGADNALFDHAQWMTIAGSESDIEILFDFGEELVGYTDFELMASAGVILDFYFFEAINEGRRQETWQNRNAFRYVTREGRQRYITRWRRGFRYMSITFRNLTSDLHLRAVRTLFSTYAVSNEGAFSCSDERLNKVWRIGRHTLQCCMEDTFTDCPAYEQTYWVGDARNEALVCYAAYGGWPLVERCVRLAAQSLHNSPLPQSQVPSGWNIILTAWSLLWIQMVDEYYFYSGDDKALQSFYPAVKQTLESCQKYCDNPFGLLSIHAWNMFDWSGQDDEHALVVHNSMFLVNALERGVRLATHLGLAADIDRWQRFKRELTKSLNDHAWSDKLNGYVDSIHADGTQSPVISQQTNTLAILYDVAPTARKRIIDTCLLEPPDHMVQFGSPFAMFYLLEALAGENKFGKILDIIRQRWGEMLDAGATAFWEMFPGYLKDVPTRSHCHAWSAAPTWFLSRYQLGVVPLEPGFASVLIAPKCEDLDWARGRVPTPRGLIEIGWAKEKNTFEFNVDLPNAVIARIELPVVADPERIVFDSLSSSTTTPKVVKSIQQINKHLVIELDGSGPFYCKIPLHEIYLAK